MKNFMTVYAYRYDEKENLWCEKELENVLVSGSKDSYNLSDTLNRDAHVTLRIMGNESVDVLPQDVISFSKSEDGTLPEDRLVVVAVRKNYWGSRRVRHTKIICK